MMLESKFVVVGGGIAGVTCVESLSSICPEESITLISASPFIKAVTNVTTISENLQSFEVEEKSPASLQSSCKNVQFIHDKVVRLDSDKHVIFTTEHEIRYEKLCICSGASPNVIKEDNEYVIGIRDTETVKNFQRKLSNARKIVVVGNGGIATELVYEINSCEVVWVIKDSSIGATFFDAGAAQFFLNDLNFSKTKTYEAVKRHKYKIQNGSLKSDSVGSALGPDWLLDYSLQGQGMRNIQVEYDCVVNDIQTLDNVGDNKWPVHVVLSNGKKIECDIVVSATGVVPNVKSFIDGNKFELLDDGGFKVDSMLQTSISDVFAAGDCCSASWDTAEHWLQMRLWTQARQMGFYASKCMVAQMQGKEILMDFCFELFTHVTRFFNRKVILLGLYNGQKLKKEDMELLVRVTKGEEYIKVVMKDGRMQGAVLIGETDLEETFENLILNKMDLSRYGEDLLDPNIDIEDYFD